MTNKPTPASQPSQAPEKASISASGAFTFPVNDRPEQPSPARSDKEAERAAFEAWALAERVAYKDEQYGLCFYDAGSGAHQWIGWQARAGQAREITPSEAYDKFVELRKILKIPGYCAGTKYTEREALNMAVSSEEEQVARHKAALDKLLASNPAGQAQERAPSGEEIKTWQVRCDWKSDEPATKLMVEAMKAEIADLRAALARSATAGTTAAPSELHQPSWQNGYSRGYSDGLGDARAPATSTSPAERATAGNAAPTGEKA